MEFTCRPGQEDQVVALLLEEYRTLRAEQVAHLGAQGNMLAFGGVTVVIVAGFKGAGSAAFWAAFGFALLLGGYFYWTRVSSMIRVARQISDIEQRLNDLAITAYGCSAPVLTWETTQQREPLRLINPLWHILRRRP
ncbi:hypothetical protein [Actinoplanes xinjiangensis]|uniref:hypothetical protein n=1 Tax=Actinoplanes xinjiangensis TaxID=512350 RepID=UPI003420C33F